MSSQALPGPRGLPLPFGNTAVVLAHPDGVERVLRSNRDNYNKGAVYDGARLLLGDGLVTAEGRDWERQRALAQPAFNSAQLAIYLHTMAECTEDLLCEWRQLPAGKSIDLTEAATRLTLAIAGRTLFVTGWNRNWIVCPKGRHRWLC